MSVSDTHSQPSHCLIFDPVPFNGGSKVASYEIVRQSLNAGVRFTVLTCDPDSWRKSSVSEHANFTLTTFKTPTKLALATYGWMFWLKQCYFLLILSMTLLKTRGVNRIVGLSGPGVDMAIYGCQKLFGLQLIQFIHGPVADSLSIGYCLTRADRTFYLESCLPSIKLSICRFLNRTVHKDCGDALTELNITAPHYLSFNNGLNEQQWPTPSQHTQPKLFWAASTLKWKGLDTLVEALQLMPTAKQPECEICFIRPKNISLPQSHAPIKLPNVTWHEQPSNLDQIRSQCSLFASTSSNEPFGLSILEALAAGLCVLIPSDNAYWDQQLTHGVNCIKYQPGDAASLAAAIGTMLAHPTRLKQIGITGKLFAKRYRAESCYQTIVDTLAATHNQSVVIKPAG